METKLLELLAKGYTQAEASQELKRLGITPNSVSIIEKRLKTIREAEKCKTIIELFVKLTKRG